MRWPWTLTWAVLAVKPPGGCWETTRRLPGQYITFDLLHLCLVKFLPRKEMLLAMGRLIGN